MIFLSMATFFKQGAVRWSKWCSERASDMSSGLKNTAEPPHPPARVERARRGAGGRAAALRRAPSDSDGSAETGSLSADSGDKLTERVPQPATLRTKRSRRRGSEWEFLEGLKDGQRYERRPEVYSGYLHKKRKWPLKGWHKRYFVVDGGILVYARGPSDVARGRLHGSVDVGLSVLSAKQRRRRIDIDADEFIYHLRAKTPDVFRSWLNVLKTHRLYRQHLLTFGNREATPRINAPDEFPNTESLSRLGSPTAGLTRGPQAGFVSGTPGGRLGSWVVESVGSLESVSRELGQAQLSVERLERLLHLLENRPRDADACQDGASPNVKKDKYQGKFRLRKKKSQASKGGSVDLQLPQHNLDGSVSHSALSALTAPPSPGGGASSAPTSAASLPIACAAARPQSLPGAESLAAASGAVSLNSLTPDHQAREDFTVIAKDLVASLKSVVGALYAERARAVETDSPPGGGASVAALRNNLSSALHQNSELKNRLARIHDASDLAELSLGANSDLASRQFRQSLSYSSSCVSEFFDAEEPDEAHKDATLLAADVQQSGVIELEGDTSSEAGSLSSEEGSASSDNSDGALLNAERGLAPGADGPGTGWTRRTRLPCPRPTPGGPSLWNLLYKNIGKDLSKISMPVSINEPLNMLQRLCEELEYSELLDAAAESRSAVERMSLVAAFAVSAYAAAAHRAASKPFNPLLGETYECIREDKGFRFIAEQVSHHPPVSACDAESARWRFWQEASIKTKFWGKSMEFQPAGRVHVRFLGDGDCYTWNKVTTCVHNLFGGQRWVDQYGEMVISSDSGVTCKINFVKASPWSASRHEVRGVITPPGGAPLRLAGRWSEALRAGDPPAARCLWRPGAMPPQHDLYYGFTRFAMELNELEPGMEEVLPGTDTRLRPDQRALECGELETAERLKSEVEQAQRERRREDGEPTPRWFIRSEGGEGEWVYGGEYWRAREAGFPGHMLRLW